MYAFTLATTTETLYNLSITLTGNFSTSGSWNASVVNIYIHSGDLLDTTIGPTPNAFITHTTNTTETYTVNFLGIDTVAYLLVSVSRTTEVSTSYRNATMSINITPTTLNKLGIQDVKNFQWNSTISTLEVQDTTPLWNITNYTYPSGGGFDLGTIAIIGGGVVVVAAAGGGVFYYTKKRGKHP